MMIKLATLAILFTVVAANVAPLLHADNPNVIPGSYIIILHDHISPLQRDAHLVALQERINITNAEDSAIGYSYTMDSFIGFAATLNKQLLAEQLQHPNVKYIEANQMMSINYKESPRSSAAVVTQTGATWGLDRISQVNLPLDGTYEYNSNAGSGVDVYVIDTGIQVTHNDFQGRATAAYSTVPLEFNLDLNGHGTHCAGTVGGFTYGVAKKVSLKAVKVLNALGSGSTDGVIKGVEWVGNNKNTSRKSVASMSLGGSISNALDDAVRSVVEGGVFFSVAAGNDNADACNYSPAQVGTACTVGATDMDDSRASYSNFGNCVHVFAPGTDITSDWISLLSNDATNTISGTSMATPHVAGVAALQLSINPNQSPAQLKKWITDNAGVNKITNPGDGSPNLLLYSNPAQ